MADAIYTDSRVERGVIGRTLDVITRGFAIGSGLILTAMAVISLVSVVGRAAFSYPIMGDYELVQMMSAVAVAMALPFCQMVRGHVIVDFFSLKFSARLNHFLDLLANILLSIGGFTFAWRMVLGLLELRRTGDSSMLLGLPTWIPYVPISASFALLGCTALYAAWEDFVGEAP
jgi:TRAP-type C4-dicarboxylate transport system permease small subunit